MTTAPTTRTAVLRARLQRRLNPGFEVAVDLALDPGVNVLFGPSGSGKTSILQMLAGLLRPDQGSIALGDRALFDSAHRVDLPPQRRRAGYVFQHLALFPHLTAAENVMFGLAHLPPPERQHRARMMLDEFFGLGAVAGRKIGQLSGGEKQRVALARALAPEPDFLLLDEPLSAVDAPTKAQILDDLFTWLDAHPVPVLYVTHDREEIFSIARHVVLLHEGKIVGEGAPDAALLHPRTLQAARSTAFENIFRARVLSTEESSGTMQCDIGGVTLDCPLPQPAPAFDVNIAVRAGDILLASELPRGLSARNIFEGTVTSLTRREHVVAVEVRCGGVTFISHVTPQAVASLALQQGSRVWIVLKTHSCHVLRD